MIKKALSKIALLLGVLAIITTVGCVTKTNVTKTMYASLNTATTLYETTYDTLEDLDNLNLISETVQPKVKAVMIKAEGALKAAIKSLASYGALSNIEDKNAFDAYLLQISTFIREVAMLLEEDV